ncbi:uncharacterized protein V1518DRAFT_405132 [Limtongia smithiae]|uniref:uncharacterized protein n=1 Tax=Limtongia smithiae TaxID=1125753 RepID=UPI0034CD23C3
MSQVEALNSSKLGTKEYWDDFYAHELQNFAENPDDEGEVWFADADAEDKVIEFLIKNSDGKDEDDSEDDYDNNDDENTPPEFKQATTSVLDLGTGNGHLIFRVRTDAGFYGRLCGIDYAATSVTFANNILSSKVESGSLDDPDRNISFRHVDFLKYDSSTENEGWDLVLDKGTLDAIALSGDKLESNGMTGIQQYPLAVRDTLLRIGGIILITSCNFTQEELLQLMDISGLEFWKAISYPVFEFGGAKGQSISSVAWRRTK